MQRDKVKTAILEATRFIGKATELLKTSGDITYQTPKESGATRRASMDLSRSLSDMRRP